MENKFVCATSEKFRSHVPDDIAFSILSKLPLKSLKRFVSKSWGLLFENSYFMSILHRNFISNLHSYYDDTSLLLYLDMPDVAANCRRSSLFSISGERFQDRVKLDWPNPFQEDDPFFCILGSINGILCLYELYGSMVVLWNPTSMEFKVIPRSPVDSLPPTQDPLIEHHGFGYDRVRDDYKVLRLVSFFDKAYEWEYEVGDTRTWDALWEIYSLRSNSWRKLYVDASREYDLLNYNERIIYLEGTCHCLGKTHNSEVHMVSFDFTNETFSISILPSDMYDNFNIHLVQKNLVLLNGSIDLISNYKDNFYISILAEPNVKESWTKLFVVGPVPSSARVIGAWRKGHIFFTITDGELACFDLSTHVIQELGVNENYCIIIYKESLRSIKINN